MYIYIYTYIYVCIYEPKHEGVIYSLLDIHSFITVTIRSMRCYGCHPFFPICQKVLKLFFKEQMRSNACFKLEAQHPLRFRNI